MPGQFGQYVGDWNQNPQLTHIYEIELHYKTNSAFDKFDGIFETRIRDITDGETVFSLVAQKTDLRMYCGSEANRDTGLIAAQRTLTFWGGNSQSFSPTADSEITFGAWKIEIP